MSQALASTNPGVAGAARGPRLAHAVLFASGFAGLGYEMVWAKMLAVALGHEIVSVLAVISAFFVGLGAGALALNGPLRRARTPQRWYVALEVVIGLWALALVWLIPWANAWIPRLIGEDPTALAHWAIAFGATLVLLLPATAAMGATLPAMERILESCHGPAARVGGLYAANTAGAVAGIVIATFVLAPRLGFTWTLALCATVNIACAMAVMGLRPRLGGDRSLETPATAIGRRDGRLLTLLLATGTLGLGYEVLAIRVLSQVLEDTVYTFAAVLAVYLLGTSAGAALYQRRQTRGGREDLTPVLLCVTATSCLLGLWTLWLTDSAYLRLIETFGASPLSAITGDLLVATLVFALPTVSMGALFSHLAQGAARRADLGVAVGVNSLGGALAAPLAGVLLLPAVGAKLALLAVSLGYVALMPLAGARGLRLAAVPAALAAAVVLMPPLRFVGLPDGGTLVDYQEGVMASVAVVEDPWGTRFLKVNNRFSMGSTSSGFADHRQTHIPLLMHPAPQRALVLGIGTGMSLDAARFHSDVEVTAVDLVPEVLEVLKHFGTDPAQSDWPRPPRLLASDARRFAVASEGEYDVVIADLFHPSRDGAGALYTREHFEAVKRRLAPGGLFCQWLPLFQMDLETLRLIVRTFLDRFPYVQLHLPHFSIVQPIVGLVGSTEPLEYRAGWLEGRVLDGKLQQALVALRLDSDFAMFGGYLAGRDALARFAGDGPLNTDDRPLVTYRAPEFAYRQRQGHGERLVDLVEALAPARGTLLAPADEPVQLAFSRRLGAFWRARDAYLEAGIAVSPDPDLEAMLAQVREPLLDVVRISGDFTPAYRPLLEMARSLSEIDPQAARALLVDLVDAAPSRDEARAALRRLSGR